MELQKTGLQKILLIAVVTGMAGACSSVPGLPLVGGGKAQVEAKTEPVATVVVSPSPVPTPPKFLAGDLLGLAPDQLDNLLGAPAFTRHEGRGQLRRYDNSVCNLIVLFVPDAAGRTVSASLEPSSAHSSTPQPPLPDCLNGF